jgi:hypothetical protein
MPRKRLAITKNQYQAMLWTYIQRREALRVKYGAKTKEYVVFSAKIRVKIATFRNAIRRFEKKELAMKTLNSKLKEFTGINVKQLPTTIPPNKEGSNIKIMARNIFYKYSIEKYNLRSPDISRFLGLSTKRHTPSTQRLTFTRSFRKNQKNRETYHSFIDFMKNNS